ncbi:MAG: ShlB/FhaC/HecB family hemolysin secretion/activation protein [Phenylobacterium sp.]
MSGSMGGALTAAIALLALAGPTVALAQASPPDAPRERTGPQAAPPSLPAYSVPSPGLLSPAPAPSGAPSGSGGGVAELRITADTAKDAATPPRGWRPPQEPGADLRLEHAPGRALDGGWVSRQFALNGLTGAGADVGRALALTQLINRAFLSAGFINSGLVAQPSPAPGVLSLRLVYGGLAAGADGGPPFSVAWAAGGSQGLDEAFVRARLAAAFGRPLNAADLERQFRLLAEDPAIRTVNADLRPGVRPGEASLAVSVYPQDRFDLYATAANDRSPSVGGEHLGLGGYARNALRPGDLLSGEIGVTQGLKDIALGYATPVLTPDTTLALRGAINDAAVVAASLQPLDIKARDRLVEAGLTQNFIDAPLSPAAEPGRWIAAKTLSGGVLVTHRVSETDLQDQPFSFSPGAVNGRSEYTALRLVGDFTVRGVAQVFAVSLTATRGLDGTRSDIPGLPTPKRHFDVLLAQVNYARRLSSEGLEFRARLTAQTADSVLYAGERLSAGGGTTVRGYRENLLLADSGLIGSLELARPIHLGAARAGTGRFDWGAFTLTGFVDGAQLRNYRPPQPGDGIYGVGAAVAWTPSDALSAQLTWGHALNKVDISGAKDLQDRGLYFSLTVRPLRARR